MQQTCWEYSRLWLFYQLCFWGRYVETTDGSRKEFVAGDVLYQDDCKKSPAEKTPMHLSGVVGDVPCNQMICQVTHCNLPVATRAFTS